MRPDELERRIRARLDPLGPAPRAELLHVLMLPDFERADRIGEFWSYPESRDFRRATDRLRGGSGTQGSARRYVAGRPEHLGRPAATDLAAKGMNGTCADRGED